MEIIESYPKLTEEGLQNLEKSLGFTLPPEYKEFLSEFNGGKPVPDTVSYNGKYFDYVSFFYAARFNLYSDDILRNIEEYKGLIPIHYLPIAESPGGDVYCISLKKEDYGSVYYWDHEMANYEGEPWEENMINLAGSLKQFLSALYHESSA